MILDGSIRWDELGPRPPAAGFNIVARRNDIYEWVRQVRGGILAGAFTVETHLSAAILHFVLGDRLRVPQVFSVFDEGLLGPLTFERRINVVLQIAEQILPDGEVKSFKAQLNEMRGLRNSMAHKPFWLHPELNDEGHVFNLVPIVMRGKSPLPLTSALIEKVNRETAALIETSREFAATAQSLSPTIVAAFAERQ